MIVYVVRHAPAGQHDPDRYPDDTQRPLTKKGRRKFARAARGLARFAAKPDVVLTSPWVRARQTAEVLAKRAGWPDPQDANALAGSADPADVIPLLANLGSIESVALVGHEPNVGELTSLLLTGDPRRLAVSFKKGGVACLELAAEVAPGRAHLLWLVGPGLLRRVTS